MKKHRSVFLIIAIICIFMICISDNAIEVNADNSVNFVILSRYSANMDIGDTMYLYGISTNGKRVVFKSSDSKVVSVSRYGKLTGKKAGTAYINATCGIGYASCKVVVNDTKVNVNMTSIVLERGQSKRLIAYSSNKSKITYRSSKKSIATVSSNGLVEAKKPGETIIYIKADNTTKECIVTVKKPMVTLNTYSKNMYKNQTYKLIASTSSGLKPKYKSNKSSVAKVDSNGMIKALKNGEATITVSLDGTEVKCTVKVLKPDITISNTEYYMKVNDKVKLVPKVSSGNKPEYKTSNSKVIKITQDGEIRALKKGKAYVYISEDGTKVKCTINVS